MKLAYYSSTTSILLLVLNEFIVICRFSACLVDASPRRPSVEHTEPLCKRSAALAGHGGTVDGHPQSNEDREAPRKVEGQPAARPRTLQSREADMAGLFNATNLSGLTFGSNTRVSQLVPVINWKTIFLGWIFCTKSISSENKQEL